MRHDFDFLVIGFVAERHASPDSEPAPGEEYGEGAGWAFRFLFLALFMSHPIPIAVNATSVA